MPRILRCVLLFGGLAIGGAAAFVAPPSALGRDWPQWLGEDREGVWRETGLLERFPAGGPKVLWRAPLGPGNSGPAVAKGRVYVSTNNGGLFCLETGDAKDDGWLMWGANAAHNGTVK